MLERMKKIYHKNFGTINVYDRNEIRTNIIEIKSETPKLNVQMEEKVSFRDLRSLMRTEETNQLKYYQPINSSHILVSESSSGIHSIPSNQEEDFLSNKSTEEHFLDLLDGNPDEISFFNQKLKIPQDHSIEEFSDPSNFCELLAQGMSIHKDDVLYSYAELISIIVYHYNQQFLTIFASDSILLSYMNCMHSYNIYFKTIIIQIILNLILIPEFNVLERIKKFDFYNCIISMLNMDDFSEQELEHLEAEPIPICSLKALLLNILHIEHSQEDELFVFHMIFILIQTNIGEGIYDGVGLFLSLIKLKFDFTIITPKQIQILASTSVEGVDVLILWEKILANIKHLYSKEISQQFFQELIKNDFAEPLIFSIQENSYDKTDYSIMILARCRYIPPDGPKSPIFSAILELIKHGTFHEKQSSIFYLSFLAREFPKEIIIQLFDQGLLLDFNDLMENENLYPMKDCLSIVSYYLDICSIIKKDIKATPGIDAFYSSISNINIEKVQPRIKQIMDILEPLFDAALQ